MKIIKSKKYLNKEAQFGNVPPGVDQGMIDQRFGEPPSEEHIFHAETEIPVEWDELKSWMQEWGNGIPQEILSKTGTSILKIQYSYSYDSYYEGDEAIKKIRIISAIDNGNPITDTQLISDIQDYFEEHLKVDAIEDAKEQRGQIL